MPGDEEDDITTSSDSEESLSLTGSGCWRIVKLLMYFLVVLAGQCVVWASECGTVILEQIFSILL